MQKKLAGLLVLGIGLSAVGLVAGTALLVSADSAGLVLLACALAILGISGLMLINALQVKVVQSLARGQEKHRKDTLRYTSAVEYRTRDLKRFLDQMQMTDGLSSYPAARPARAAGPRSTNVPFDGGVPLTFPAMGETEGSSKPRIARPNGIKALTPKPQSGAETAGRLAAAVDRDARREGILRGLLTPVDQTGADPRSLVVLLGGSDLADRLREAADVLELNPSFMSIPADASYVVIDESALRSGVWTSTTSAVGTRRFATLQRELRAARNRGSAIIILTGEGSTGNFDHDLRNMGELVISPDGYETSMFGWAEDISTPVITILNRFVRGREAA